MTKNMVYWRAMLHWNVSCQWGFVCICLVCTMFPWCFSSVEYNAYCFFVLIINTCHNVSCSAFNLHINFKQIVERMQSIFRIIIVHIHRLLIRSSSVTVGNVEEVGRVPLNSWNIVNSFLVKSVFTRHFFLAASRFGADTLTLPGMFLDKSASCNIWSCKRGHWLTCNIKKKKLICNQFTKLFSV